MRDARASVELAPTSDRPTIQPLARAANDTIRAVSRG